MSKKEFAHGTARGGYSNEQGIPLAMVSDQGLIEEVNRRGLMLMMRQPTKLKIIPNTKDLTLVRK
jgi:hypothetical protein